MASVYIKNNKGRVVGVSVELASEMVGKGIATMSTEKDYLAYEAAHGNGALAVPAKTEEFKERIAKSEKTHTAKGKKVKRVKLPKSPL